MIPTREELVLLESVPGFAGHVTPTGRRPPRPTPLEELVALVAGVALEADAEWHHAGRDWRR